MTTLAAVGPTTNTRPAPEAPLVTADGTPLAKRLAQVSRQAQFKALLFVLPILIFTLIVFVYPLGRVLWLSVADDVIAQEMPLTVARLKAWDPATGLPDEATFAAAVADLKAARERQSAGRIGAQMNHVFSGARSATMNAARASGRLEPPFAKSLPEANEAWGDPRFWVILKSLASKPTSIHYLNAVDRTRDTTGRITKVPEELRIHLTIFWKTFWLSGLVTVICLALGYPVALLLSQLPARIANLLMICVLLPFWTALLVRITAWIAMLQSDGVILASLAGLGMVAADTSQRPQLVYNLTGTLVAMVHVLMPSMILPLYSVMKTIPPTYMRAARSLGADPFTAFWRVYFPQTLPGIAAGGLLVFILCVGYYITPALLGGQDGVLISNFIALHMQSSLNWGLAAALSILLLLAVLILYWLFNKIVGVDGLKMG